jgi:hypothetical protein
MGRMAKLIVNGEEVLENAFWVPDDSTASRMTCGYGDATIRPGANRFELRICTSEASQGPSCRQSADGPKWIKSKFGFVVDVSGRNSVGRNVSNAYTYYKEIKDTGDASFLTWGVIGTSPFYRHPETGASIAFPTPQFDKMVFASGAVLDCAGFDSYSAANVEGFPTVVNCGSFAIAGDWILPVSRLGGESIEMEKGRLDLSGATLCIDKDAVRRIATGTSFAVAEAAGGIWGLPALSAETAEDWSVELSGDGTTLSVVKKSPGFSVIIR